MSVNSTSYQTNLKDRVKNHWERETCGTRYGDSAERMAYFDQISAYRYLLEPYIKKFADFPSTSGLKILEIGVGAGSDFYNWIINGAEATGIDLTDKSIELTQERLELCNIPSEKYHLQRMDAENLSFESDSFDMVYSWGVLHHTPDTTKAFSEVFRVLKPGGTVKAMIYHVPSWTGWMLWARYGLLRGRRSKSIKQVIFENLESFGTKAYSTGETKYFLNEIGFEQIETKTILGPGDLLTIKPSKKYQSFSNKIIWALYPRRIIKLFGDSFGLNLTITAKKPV